MLPNMGYFRSIDCPSIFKDGACKRPYCHFRHSSAFGKTAKVSTSDKTSVLHGARGAAALCATSSVKYDVSIASKPADDMEYDPMSNFNLRGRKSKQETKQINKIIDEDSSDSVVDLTKDEVSDADLITDDSISTEKKFLKDINSDETSNDEFIEYIPQSVKHKQKKNSIAIEKSLEIVVISDSDEGVANTKVNILSNTEVPTQKHIHPDIVNDLFGTDSENDVKVKAKKKSEKKVAPEKKTLIKKTKLLSKKVKKDEVSSNSKLSTKKDSSKATSTKQISAKAASIKQKPKPNDEKSKKKDLKRRRNSDLKTLIKEKVRKVDDSSNKNACDVGKYVSKDEIEKLDKELLNDVGKYDECYQIYQETLKKEGSSQRDSVKKPAKVFENSMLVVDKNGQKQDGEKAYNPPEKTRRVAHTSASLSARNLNRDRKHSRRLLTPAQSMMQRMETIQREQEERILSSIPGLTSKSTSSSSANSTLSGNFYKAQSNRLAHQPSKSSSNLLNKQPTSLASRALKKRPFQDLRSKPASDTTTQTTIPKGFQRKAHSRSAPSDNFDVIEKPTILPDRHSKVPTNLRQRYLTVFIDECIRIFDNDKLKAYDMAKTEESQCNNRSKTKTIYLSLAASTLKRLRSTISEVLKPNVKSPESSSSSATSVKTSPAKLAFKMNNIRVAHNTPTTKAVAIQMDRSKVKLKKTKENVNTKNRICKGGFSIQKEEKPQSPSAQKLYENMRRYLLTDEQLGSNGFPRPGDITGTCSFKVEKPSLNINREKKTCTRCGKDYFMSRSGYFFNENECIYHWGKALNSKVGSHIEKRYTCCQTPSGSEGCTIGETHVHKDNTISCSSYVKTFPKMNSSGNPGMYALDCEMAFTVAGLELIRVSVVDFDCELVYDSLVKPEGKILDCNTRWSGLTIDDLKGVETTLHDVQAVLLNKFSSDTVLVGHSLESDLVALRIIHSSVIDTSVVFPHRFGPPLKRALRTLLAENLGIIIQNSVDEGHDSMEDASACIKLMKWKLDEDLKVAH